VLFPIVHISFTGAMLNEPAQWFRVFFWGRVKALFQEILALDVDHQGY
jgi:hypothetical protein